MLCDASSPASCRAVCVLVLHVQILHVKTTGHSGDVMGNDMEHVHCETPMPSCPAAPVLSYELNKQQKDRLVARWMKEYPELSECEGRV